MTTNSHASVRRASDSVTVTGRNDESEALMTTIPLPGDHPRPETGPERVSLVRLAAQSNGSLSLALARAVSNGVERRGPGRVAVAAFQSSV